jgi:hypothetical protein
MEIIIGLIVFLLLKIAMFAPFAGEIGGTNINSLKRAGLH